MALRKSATAIFRGILALIFSICVSYASGYLAVTTVSQLDSTYAHLVSPTQKEQSKATVSYLLGPAFVPNPLTFFTPKEQSHLTDVKRLIDEAYVLSWLSLLIAGAAFAVALAIGIATRDFLLAGIRNLGWLLLSFGLGLGLMVHLDFGRSWHYLHTIFFPQGNFRFSRGSLLLELYPPEFFITLIGRSGAAIFGLTSLVVLGAYFFTLPSGRWLWFGSINRSSH